MVRRGRGQIVDGCTCVPGQIRRQLQKGPRKVLVQHAQMRLNDARQRCFQLLAHGGHVQFAATGEPQPLVAPFQHVCDQLFGAARVVVQMQKQSSGSLAGAIVTLHPEQVWRAASRYNVCARSSIEGKAPKRDVHGMRRVMPAEGESMVPIRIRAGFSSRFHCPRRSRADP